MLGRVMCFQKNGLKILVFNHPGNKSQFTTLKKGESSVQRCEKQLLIVYDEQSIMDRPGVPHVAV